MKAVVDTVRYVVDVIAAVVTMLAYDATGDDADSFV